MILIIIEGGESKSYSDTTFCGWNKHIEPNTLWDSFTCCYRRLLYICCPYNFNHFGRSIQQHWRPHSS